MTLHKSMTIFFIDKENDNDNSGAELYWMTLVKGQRWMTLENAMDVWVVDNDHDYSWTWQMSMTNE